jgi:hypothetical protein
LIGGPEYAPIIEYFWLKRGRKPFSSTKYNTKYISYGALSRDVFTEKLTLLQEFLKSHADIAVAD